MTDSKIWNELRKYRPCLCGSAFLFQLNFICCCYFCYGYSIIMSHLVVVPFCWAFLLSVFILITTWIIATIVLVVVLRRCYCCCSPNIVWHLNHHHRSAVRGWLGHIVVIFVVVLLLYMTTWQSIWSKLASWTYSGITLDIKVFSLWRIS